jgi:hypothetical protein
MPISRDFRTLALQDDGSILIEGITRTGEEDVPAESILALHVMLVSVPDYAHMVHSSIEGDVPPMAWELTIPDAPAPFDQPGPIVAIGFVKYLNETGGTEDHIWGGETELTGP